MFSAIFFSVIQTRSYVNCQCKTFMDFLRAHVSRKKTLCYNSSRLCEINYEKTDHTVSLTYFLINYWHEATLIRRRWVYIAMIWFEFSSREMLINMYVYIRSSIIKNEKKCSVNTVKLFNISTNACMQFL